MRGSSQDSTMASLTVFLLSTSLLLLMLLWTTDTRMTAVTAPGDVIIGGIFPVHEDVDKTNQSFAPHPQPCTRLDERILVRVLTMINAIEVINKSPILTDLNITLGYRILDSCSDVSTSLRAVADFSQQDHCLAGSTSVTCHKPVMVVVGATYSEISIAVARHLTLKMIPQVSYSSTAVILSDKNRFPAFMRTIPNDKHQTAAMASLLSSYGWNWVGIVTTDGDYGRSALDNFVTQATARGICVAFKSILPQSVFHQDVHYAVAETAETILDNPKVQVIVSFVKPALMRYLYQELHDQAQKAGQSGEVVRRVWVASDGWSTASTVRGNLTLDDIGQVVGFTFKNGDLTSLYEYLSRLEAADHNYTQNNPFLHEFYQQLNESREGPDAAALASEAVDILKQHSAADRVLSIEMAISAIAQAVVATCRVQDCKTPGNLQPWQLLRSLWMEQFTLGGKSYNFDHKGDINLGYAVTFWRSDGGTIRVHDVVAEYHPHNNSFTHTSHPSTSQFQDLQRIISKCSDTCLPGEYKNPPEGLHTCCYKCRNCTKDHYSNSTDMSQCLSCDDRVAWSPEGSSSCIPKTRVFFSWRNGFAVALLTFSALGIMLALLVSALFLHQRHTPVVRAAVGPLSQVILFSLVFSYVSAMLFVGKPNSFQCKARQVLFGVSFTLCVSCILAKTLRILLAFQLTPELQQFVRHLHQPQVIVSVCVALQVAICICWLVLKSPDHGISPDRTTLLEYCDEGSYLAFGLMLGYIAVLAFVCFICAFKGRKLPQHYNEAKFITFSMLLYLISWLLFIPVYVNTSGVYLPAVEMVVILISNYGILGCHFLPKCYIILFKKKHNTRSAFRRNLYNYSRKPTDSESVLESSEPQTQAGVFSIAAYTPRPPSPPPLSPLPSLTTSSQSCPLKQMNYSCTTLDRHTQRCHRRRTSL